MKFQKRKLTTFLFWINYSQFLFWVSFWIFRWRYLLKTRLPFEVFFQVFIPIQAVFIDFFSKMAILLRINNFFNIPLSILFRQNKFLRSLNGSCFLEVSVRFIYVRILYSFFLISFLILLIPTVNFYIFKRRTLSFSEGMFCVFNL